MDKRGSPVAIARRRVAEAESRVARQEQLVLRLQERKHTTILSHAQRILEVLRQSLDLSRVNLQLEIDHYGDTPTGEEPGAGEEPG